MTKSHFTLSARIKHQARRLGFDHCRIIPVGEAPHADFFDTWIDAGRAGEMHYLERNREKRRNPALLLNPQSEIPNPQSLIILAVNYRQFDLPPSILNDPSRGIIASYAWGNDYHEIIRPLLYQLDEFIRSQTGRSESAKCLVDTGPVLERDWAMQAGIGFTGKNCCTIHPQDGSWLLLATMVVTEGLEYDCGLRRVPVAGADCGNHGEDWAVSVTDVMNGLLANQSYGKWLLEDPIPLEALNPQFAIRNPQLTCGRCTRCLDACPTRAFVGPYHLDPQRCISYWTIETQSPIPRELRAHFGNRIFGCDICQEVCPWNKRLPERSPLQEGLHAQQSRIAPPLLEGFAAETPYWLNQAAFAECFRRSPIKRAKRHGMLRNVCVALGNWADPVAVPALQMALTDEHAVVRIHAVWALGQILHRHYLSAIRPLLEDRRSQETHSEVIDEINWVLG
ncbi:MAG: QueG-associated DUF1730 domain-containing protein [Caldilineaceae bacterium]